MKRNNLSKRILSVVMVCVMLLGYFPVSIWAVETSTDIKAIEKPTGFVIVEDFDDYFGDNWEEKLELPETVKVTLADGSTTNASVTWDISALDTRTTGFYYLPGNVTLPSGATNGQNLGVNITIQVRETVNLYDNPSFEANRNGWSFGYDGDKDKKATPAAVGQYALQVHTSTSQKTSANLLYPATSNRLVLAQRIVEQGAGQYYIGAQVRDYLYSTEVAHTDDLSVYIRVQSKKNASASSYISVGQTQNIGISDSAYTSVGGVFELDGDETEILTNLFLTSATAFTSQYVLVDDMQFIPLKVALKVEPANIVEIKTEVLSRSVVRNYPDYVGQDWKTALGLPTSVEVLMDNGNTASVGVTWSYAGLDFTKYGKYTLVGSLDKTFPNPKGLAVQQNIYVGKVKNLVTNPSFETNIDGWTLSGANPKPGRVQSPVKEGAYAAMTGNFTTSSKRVSFAYTKKADEAMGKAIGELGGGQFYFGAWVQHSGETMPSGIGIETWFLHKTQDENGVLAKDAVITKSESVPLSNTEYSQNKGVVELPANTAWVQIAVYVSAQNSTDLGAPLYLDNVELIPLNVTIPKDQEPADVTEVLSEIPVRAVVENYDSFVGSNWKSALGLPATVEVRTSGGNIASVDVEWDFTPLNLKKPGKYTLIGTLDNSAYPNPKELFVKQTIHIIEYRNLVNNPSFESGLSGWSLRGGDINPSRVDTAVKNGKYAALSGAYPTTGFRTAVAYTHKDEQSMANAIMELGAGQYYYSVWAQHSAATIPGDMGLEAWFLYKTKDENGILASSSTVQKSDTFPLSNKEYSQAKGIAKIPANAAWTQLAVYVSSQESAYVGQQVYVDYAEVVPLNLIIEQYEGEMVQVESIIPDRQIIQNYPDYIGDSYTKADLMLPSTVEVSTTAGQTVKVGVRWDTSKLDLTKTGIYTVYGALEDMKLPNPDGLTVKQNIRVVSKKNLLNNPSFEDDADGWDNSGHVSLELGTTSPVKDGGLSMKIKVGRLDGRTQKYIQSFYNGGTASLGQYITATGAGRYLFSGWAQGTASTKNIEFNLRMWYMCLSNGDKSSYAETDFAKLSTTEFTQMSNIVEFPDDVYSAHLDFYFWGEPSDMRLSEVYLDDFELIPLNIEIANINDIIDCEDTADYYVHEGTAFEDLKLPEALRVVIKSSQQFDLGVTWDSSDYDPNKVGVQYITGSLNLKGIYKNPKKFTPIIKVTVRAKGEELRQTIYLSTSGDEANNGLSPDSPKQDIKKIPTYLSQGYNVKLKRGDIWYNKNGGITLDGILGTEDAPLTLGAYGSGDELPTIAFMMKIENSAWKLVDAKRNVYAADVSSLTPREGINVHRCFVNDVSYTHILRSNYVTLDVGEVCNYGGKLYIRMEKGTAPTNVEVTPMSDSGYPLHIENVSHLNIEYIHIKGTLGLKALIRCDAPTEFVKFRYCSITHGYYYHMMWLTDNELIHYKPEVSHCYIDAMFNEAEGFRRDADDGPESWWNVTATEGITMRDGVDGAWIHNNHIRNMSHVFICIDTINADKQYTTTGVRNCIIEDNLLEGEYVMYARPFSINGVYNLSGIQMVRDNIVRRNRCYDMSSSSHFFGENNIVYSNLFCHQRVTYREDGTLFAGKGAVGAAIDQTVYSGRVSYGNMVVNNTFVNCSASVVINDTAGTVDGNLYANNLMVNWFNDAPKYPGAFFENSKGMNYVMNNATYSVEGRMDPFVVDQKIYSSEDVNNAVTGYSGNRSGDPLFKTADASILDKFARQEFDLSKESPYRYAGISLYDSVYAMFPAWERLMEDYTDVNGVVYLAESPSIGAYSFCEKIKGDVAEVGKLNDILARPGAKFDQLNLPSAVPATNDQGIEVMLLPTWSDANFDSSKPGTITITAQLRNGPHTELNINGKTASININIKDKLKLLNVTTLLKPLTILYGTSLENAIKQLPQTLDVMEESGYQEALPVTWECYNYNPTKPDVYTFKCILPEDMLTNADDFDLRVEVRVLHEIGRGMELLVNPNFIDGTSAAPWKIGFGSGTYKITKDPRYLMPGVPGAAIVTATSRYASIQQDVTGQMQLMGDGKYLFKVYMRTYDPSVIIDGSVAFLQVTGPITHEYFCRAKSNIGTNWVEYNTVMNVKDIAQATQIMFHTSTYKSKEDVKEGVSYLIAGCSLIYLGNTDAEVEATMDSIGLDWNTIRGENGLDKVVTTNLNLPTSIGLGSEIKWSSSDESAITNDGKVTMGRVAKTVTLTATITYNGIETVKKFNVTVPRNPELPTFTGSLNGSQAVNIGDEFKVTISLAGEKATYFNAYRFTLSFNSSKLEYVSCSDAASTVEVEGGRITISGIGTERPITDTITLTFKAKKSGITEVKLVKVEMDLDPNASLDTLPTMTVKDGAAVIDVQKVGEDDEAPVAEQDDSGVIWIIIGLVAAALICGGVIAVIVIKKKKQTPPTES